MRIHRSVALPILLILLTLSARAEGLFKTYSVGEGLTQSQVYAIHQDARGYLWIATLGGGVSRFDGTRFLNLTRADGLAGDVVFAIAEDASGALWFATDGGLSRYDGETFENLGVAEGLPHKATTALVIDRQARLWVGTQEGLARLESGVPTRFSSADDLSGDQIHALAEDRHGVLWVGTEKGVDRIRVEPDGTWAMLPPDNGLPRDTVLALTEDRAGNMWVGTYRGVVRFDGERGVRLDKSDGLAANEVRSILEDRSGRLWFGTARGGVSVRDGTTFRTLDEDDGLGSDTVWAMLQDREDTIWLGTYRGGISRYTGERFVHFNTKDGLGDDAVRAIVPDHRGDLWVGTIAGGVSRFDGSSFDNFSTEDGLPSDFVISLMEDSDHRLWIGTFRGLSRFDGRTFSTFTEELGVSGQVIRFILEDRHGSVWVATNSSGLSRFDGELFETFTKSDGLGSDSIMTLLETRDGRLWIGTDSGIATYDGERFRDVSAEIGVDDLVNAIVEDEFGDLWFGTYGGIVHYSPGGTSKRFTNADGLENERVVSLVFDAADGLWIGSEHGLDRLDLAAYRTDGSKHFRHFDREEGFSGIECIGNAVARDDRGFLWFGTIAGLTRVDPSIPLSTAVEPQARLTDIKLFSQQIDRSRFGSELAGPARLPAGLRLAHDENHITFDFEAISLTAPNSLRYRYMIEGLDKDWSREVRHNHAIYAGIPPGEYVFKVAAKSPDGHWSSGAAAYGFVIRRPFWQAWWFYLLCLVGLAATVGVTIRVRTRSLLGQRAVLQEQVRLHTQNLAQEKEVVEQVNRELEQARAGLEQRVRQRTAELAQANTELRDEMQRREALEQELVRAQKLESLGVLAGGIAHDFNNLLMSILGNISLAKTRLAPNVEAKKILEQAEKACDRTRDLTRQLQLLTKGGAAAERRAISPTAIIEETIRFVMMGASSICKLDLPEELWHIEGDPGQISRVFHNVVLNAQESMGSGGVIEIHGANVVHDREGRIPLEPGRYVRITITDQGSGISEEELPRVFDPYYTSKEKGSGLGLALTYSIVKRHGGFISIDSTSGEGTAISIYLPAASAVAAVEQPQAETETTGSGRVLVMDDEELVRSVASEMLSDLGYDVEVAIDGAEAVSRYKQAAAEGRPFHAVILDLTVRGGMGGLDAMRVLLEFDPQVRAVVSSGYSNDMVLEKYAEHGFKNVLPKPYRVNEMGRVLGRVLSA